MTKRFYLLIWVLLVITTGCAVNKKNSRPQTEKTFTSEQLKQDYSVLRNILEKKHPSLYWYTPQEEMNHYFDSLYNNIADSMTEQQFGWDVLAPLTQKIHCGHTSFGMSKSWKKFMKNKQVPGFPLHLKVWGDTMVLTVNLNKKDSILRRGMVITSINNISSHELVQRMFQYLPMDGYADNVNYVRLSSNFPYYHRNIFGLYKNYRVGYIDSAGRERKILLPMYVPFTDSSKKVKQFTWLQKTLKKINWFSKQRRKERKATTESYRSLKIDTALNTALITLNTFNKKDGKHLRHFFKHSFKKIKKNNINHLVLDLRGNGGGDVGMYILLTKYLRHTRFKVADTVCAASKSLSPYTKYIKNGLAYNLGLIFLVKKKQDRFYHYGYMERHFYKPKKKNHFNGKMYVLINGPTFSASTLLCNAVKGQSNVTLIGEETGGGWYGNSGIFIPDIILPHTKLHVRLPLFKLVQFNHTDQKGKGIPPDIYIPPSVEAVKKGVDRKMEYVKELILEAK